MDKELKKIAADHGIRRTVLTILSNSAGPNGYKVSQDADVTVILYVKYTVRANHAFGKGRLGNQAVDAIVADLSKMLE